jgi:hypothetical protein
MPQSTLWKHQGQRTRFFIVYGACFDRGRLVCSGKVIDTARRWAAASQGDREKDAAARGDVDRMASNVRGGL